jgi:dTMP kinase
VAADTVRAMSNAPTDRTTLVALLGIDGSGKTTQAARLVEWLQSHGETVEYRKTRSGGRTKLDKAARGSDYESFAALVGDDRAAVALAALGFMHLHGGRDDLKKPGTWLVVDRYAQCHKVRSHQLWPDGLERLEIMFQRFAEPDLMLYMTIDPAIAADRTVVRGVGRPNTAEELVRMNASYRALPEAARYVEIDANRDPDDVHQSIVAAVAQRFDLS